MGFIDKQASGGPVKQTILPTSPTTVPVTTAPYTPGTGTGTALQQAADAASASPNAKPGSGSALLDSLTNLSAKQASASAYLSNKIASSLSTFNIGVDGLAGGIGKSLTNLFANTKNVGASTVTTAISDPVKTNLLSTTNKPGASAFKVDGLSADSKAVSASGAKTLLGSDALRMTGITAVTMVNRFKTDISKIASIPGLVAASLSTQRLNGLFTSASIDIANGLASNAKDPLLQGLISNGSYLALTSVLGVGSRNGVAAKISGTAQNLANEISSFTGVTSGLSAALGVNNLSAYYTNDLSYSLLNSDRVGVNTYGSGVDATTANAITDVLRQSGCNVSLQGSYQSANQQASLFGLGLILAAVNGLKDLVSDITTCSYASTITGQSLLGTAFAASAGTQPGIAYSILENIDNPNGLYDADLGYSIVGNSDLTGTDVGTIDAIFTYMGVDTKTAISVPAASSASYPVYNEAVVASMTPDFTNTLYGDTTISDYLQGLPVVTDASGKLSLFA